jgi:hypothetical protein
MGNICFCYKNYLTKEEIEKEKELDNRAFKEILKKISERNNDNDNDNDNDNSCSSNSSTHDIYDSTESLCACCNDKMTSTIELDDSNNSIELIHPLQYNSLFNEKLNSIDENNIDEKQIKRLTESNITQSSNGSNSYIFANFDDYTYDISIDIKKNN